jgi:hypothetical protein
MDKQERIKKLEARLEALKKRKNDNMKPIQKADLIREMNSIARVLEGLRRSKD